MRSLGRLRAKQFRRPDLRLGATYVAGEGTFISLWAPKVEKAAVVFEGRSPFPLARQRDAHFTGFFSDIAPGARYEFEVDGARIPDPASRFQPQGVFGSSEIVGTEYGWQDAGWAPPAWEDWVIYELHVGAFSAGGDFQGVVDDLPRLRDLGITAIELMPVAQFPGARNWGYDGVFPHAVQNTYGGPHELKKLVDACHAQGIAIILDVVFNHLGPEGNVLFPCAPFNQPHYKLPWGDAINFDGEGNEHVRRYFLQSAWQWLDEFRFDGLRVDSIPNIIDNSAVPFLEELNLLAAEIGRRQGRKKTIIAESDRNDPRVVLPLDLGGLGFDAQWSEDFHAALHATLTGETKGYYADFGRGPAQLARIYRNGVYFHGQYAPNKKCRWGRGHGKVPHKQLVVAAQNHDQTGNRIHGDRLTHMLDIQRLKLAAAALLLSPFTPLLFMGEEFYSKNPFLYFVDYADAELKRKTKESRREKYLEFGWTEEQADPADPATFEKCVLKDKNSPAGSKGAALADYYKNLIALSKRIRRLKFDEVTCADDVIVLRYEGKMTVFLSFKDAPAKYRPPENWKKIFDSSDAQEEDLPPFAARVFERKD